MTGLRHQFLPRIFDLKMGADGYCYTIMELIPGCTLRQYVRMQGALDQRQTVFWLKQLAQAAAYMHSQRPPILHSDIKPDNIMITPQGDICLIDFNASLEMRDDGADALAVTACYAAPEQYNVPLSRFGDPARLDPEQRQLYDMASLAQGLGKVTVRSDLYAIGATAYFMLTGYDPDGWEGEMTSLERFDITLGDPLRQVIERCLAFSPAKRFASAGELLRALNNLARTDKRYRAWRRSCQAAALVVGAGMILSAFLALWGWMQMGQETGEAYNDLIRQAQALGEQMDYDGQQELLLEAIQLDRDRPEAYANLGGLLYELGDYGQAVDLLSQLEPDRTGALSQGEAAVAQGQIQYILASCYYQQENYGEAMQCYELASYFCPEEAAYQRDLAVCYARLGYQEQAQQAVDVLRALPVQPGDVELVSGEIAYAGGDFQQALEQLSQAVALAEDHTVISRASLQAAQCCRRLGSGWIGQEIAILEDAAARLDVSENGAQLQLLAETLIRQGGTDSYERALDCLEELMNRGQATFTVRQNAALVLEYLDRFGEAEALLLQLQADYPQDYRPPMRLALLYADWEGSKAPAARNYSQFQTAYQQALSLYAASDAPDSNMVQLQELAALLGL